MNILMLNLSLYHFHGCPMHIQKVMILELPHQDWIRKIFLSLHLFLFFLEIISHFLQMLGVNMLLPQSQVIAQRIRMISWILDS